MFACSVCCFASLSGFTPLRCCPCLGLPHCSVFLVRVCPALGQFSLSGFIPLRVCLVWVFAVAMFSLSGSTLLLCVFLSGFTPPLLRFPCPGLSRCDVFLVRVYPGFDACGFIVARGKYIIYNLNIYLLERPSEQSRATQGQVHQRLPPFAQLL